MQLCHVDRWEPASFEEQMAMTGFKGNKPALPPLTTESVPSVFYLMEEEPTTH